MNFWVRFLVSTPLVMTMALGFSGCDQPRSGSLDEEKEPFYLAGKSRVNAMDFRGAIESFEKALDNNPHSAAAHLQLGWLFENKQPDPAAAIYHYEKFLKLRPKTEHADAVRQHILACKQELARAISLGPVAERQQREMEVMDRDNKRLIDENRQLSNHLFACRVELASMAARGVAPTITPTGNAPSVSTFPPTNRIAAPAGRAQPQPPSASSGSGRVHVIQPRETLSHISKRYGVSVEKIRAANPGLDERRLRPGRTLRIP